MALALTLLFISDLFVLVADGLVSEVWQCPNTSASELIQQIWEENRNLSLMLLDLDIHGASGEHLVLLELSSPLSFNLK